MTKRRKKKHSNFKNPFRFVLLIIVVGLMFHLMKEYKVQPLKLKTYRNIIDLRRTQKNYADEVDDIAAEFDLPSSYLKALVALECSGKIEFEPRFEEHVFNALKQVRDGKIKRYGSITKKHIGDANDDALRNLATSWGPFQLMGYQCIPLEVKIQDIRGKNNIYWGIYWINKSYGRLLKKGEYADCFHIHNTGQRIPDDGKHLTHNSSYVERGLSYMEYFDEN